MEENLLVGIGEYKVSKGKAKIMTRDLGSCVGIALRDSQNNIGGLLHILLPNCSDQTETGERTKYADTGIELMVSSMCKLGANKNNIVAKIAGGAHMYQTKGVPECEDISSRNVRAVKEKLSKMSIPILAEETGNNIPRTVIFDIATGACIIKTVGKPDRFI